MLTSTLQVQVLAVAAGQAGRVPGRMAASLKMMTTCLKMKSPGLRPHQLQQRVGGADVHTTVCRMPMCPWRRMLKMLRGWLLLLLLLVKMGVTMLVACWGFAMGAVLWAQNRPSSRLAAPAMPAASQVSGASRNQWPRQLQQ